MHSESQWRYRAKRRGLRLVRYSQSLGYQEYGPYGLVDRTTGSLVKVRLGPEDVERILFGTDGEAVELGRDGEAVELMVDGQAVEFSGFSKALEARGDGKALEARGDGEAGEAQRKKTVGLRKQ